MYVKVPWNVISFQITLAINNDDAPPAKLKANLDQDNSEWKILDHSVSWIVKSLYCSR